MNEYENVRLRYEARKTCRSVKNHFTSPHYYRYIKAERNSVFARTLQQRFVDFAAVKIIEIGAGGGHNLHLFNSLGVLWENIWANELLKDRGEVLTRKLPKSAHVEVCNALDLDHVGAFDVALQCAVFTSILDQGNRQELATKLLEMLKPTGVLLWYDFKIDNPFNRDVRGVSKKEVKRLFSAAKKITFHNVTLAPPIGRRIGRLYPLMNTLFPFLRTHLIGVIEK